MAPRARISRGGRGLKRHFGAAEQGLAGRGEKKFQSKTTKIQNTVDQKSRFDRFCLPRSGRDCRASLSIGEPKKFFKKRLTMRNDALRCTARNGAATNGRNDGVKKNRKIRLTLAKKPLNCPSLSGKGDDGPKRRCRKNRKIKLTPKKKTVSCPSHHGESRAVESGESRRFATRRTALFEGLAGESERSG